jgi:hypothetical protein
MKALARVGFVLALLGLLMVSFSATARVVPDRTHLGASGGFMVQTMGPHDENNDLPK